MVKPTVGYLIDAAKIRSRHHVREYLSGCALVPEVALSEHFFNYLKSDIFGKGVSVTGTKTDEEKVKQLESLLMLSFNSMQGPKWEETNAQVKEYLTQHIPAGRVPGSVPDSDTESDSCDDDNVVTSDRDDKNFNPESFSTAI